ncbi:hypothetical protein PanWU01x14_156140, partial [Parasponia andersonii]
LAHLLRSPHTTPRWLRPFYRPLLHLSSPSSRGDGLLVNDGGVSATIFQIN